MPHDEEEEGRERVIVLLRHGIAEEPTPEKPDTERALTPEGHARMMKLATGLERAFPKAQVIYSSPLVRAMQTALWVSKAYRSRLKINQADSLVPGSAPEAFIEFLKSVPERRIIAVGHEPVLTSHALALLGITKSGHGLELKKGACYALRLHGERDATLEWMLSPRILRRLAE